LRRASACRIERDVRVQEERHVVPRNVHIALVDLGRPGHGVEVFHLRTVRIVLDNAVGVLVADAEDLVQRLAFGELDDGVVELTAADEVEDFALVQSAVGVGCHRRSDEADLDGRVGLLDGAGEPVVAGPAYSRGKEHEELEALGDLDGLLGADVVGRSVEQLGALEHAGGIRQPDGVPVGFDLARRGPTGAGTTVEVFKGRRVQEQSFKWHI
jgi:hypothetical protein